MALLRRLWYALHRRRFERDLAEEIELHRELARRELEAGGVGAADAAAAAQRRLGSVALAHNQARDVWIAAWIQDVLLDFRLACRMLARDRRFTAAAVLALGLGIGVTNSVFAIVNTILIRDLPFERADRLIGLSLLDRDGRNAGFSYPDFLEWRDAATTFAGIAAASEYAPMNVSEEGRAPERFLGTYISTNAFALLRATPIVGRDFVPDDERRGAPPVAILSYNAWKQRYRLDPAIVGRTVRINNLPSVVIGVMPPRFKFPMITEVWQPLSLSPAASGPRRDARTLRLVFGRLSDAADLASARADVATIAAGLARTYPDSYTNLRASVKSLKETIVNTASMWPILMTFMGAVAFVLLIACANVASLSLARVVSRSREVAIRASLGATRWRIVRQMLIECLVLAALASAVGLALSLYGAREMAVASDPIQPGVTPGTLTPFYVDVTPDATVFAFTALVCLGVCLAFGLIPALHVAGVNTAGVIKEGGPSGHVRARRLTGAFIVAELALTFVLLTGTGLLWRSFYALYRMDQVIDANGLVAARLALPAATYDTTEKRRRFFAQLDQRLSQLPPLSAFTTSSSVPLSPASPLLQRQLETDDLVASRSEKPTVSYIYAGPRYVETIGLGVVRGRALRESDGFAGQEGAIVDERFVSVFFPGGDAIGRRIRLTSGSRSDAPTPWLTIVGVVRTVPSFPLRLAQPLVVCAARCGTFAGADARPRGTEPRASRRARPCLARTGTGAGPGSAALRHLHD